MVATIINNGGSIRIPKNVEVAYSTPVLLTQNDRKILIDPGDYTSFGFLEKYFENHNINLEDVTDILLTHLHLDHAYATRFFPNATIYINGAYKSKPYNKFGLFKSKLYLEIINSWKNVVEIDAGMKLFNGKVVVFHTPWHAKEHCSFVIDTENMGKILYTGDIVMNRVEFYDIIRWLRKDDCARFINTIGRKCDYIVFTHDEYVKSDDYFRR